MIVRIDQKSEEPLYLQIRSQIIAAIARGELVPGTALPSVRSLASDLGINLHTVSASSCLGMSLAMFAILDPGDEVIVFSPYFALYRAQIELAKMEDELFELALAHRARGGSRGEFLECASAQAARAYAALERADADSVPSTQAARAAGAGRLPIEAGFAPACGKDA